MHIKTGWTPRDYLDLYVTDDGETFDLVQGGQAGNNDALPSTGSSQTARPSWTHTTKYSVRRGAMASRRFPCSRFTPPPIYN